MGVGGGQPAVVKTAVTAINARQIPALVACG